MEARELEASNRAEGDAAVKGMLPKAGQRVRKKTWIFTSSHPQCHTKHLLLTKATWTVAAGKGACDREQSNSREG